MEAGPSSARSGDGTPTEQTPLLAAAATPDPEAAVSPPEADRSADDALADGDAPGRTRPTLDTQIKRAVWTSIVSATLAIAFGAAVGILENVAPSSLSRNYDLHDGTPPIISFAVLALVVSICNLRMRNAATRPFLIISTVVVDVMVFFYVFAFAVPALNRLEYSPYCYNNGYEDDDEACHDFKRIFVVIAGFFLAFAILLVFTHAALFIMRMVRAFAGLDRPEHGGVLSGFRLTIGPLTFEGKMSVLGRGEWFARNGGDRSRRDTAQDLERSADGDS